MIKSPMYPFLTLFLLLALGCKASGGSNPPPSYKVRPPAVAGSFYPADPKNLRRVVQDFLKKVPDQDIPGELVACIAPHAGYVYSGQVAAYTHKLLEEADFEIIVIIGHNAPYGNKVAFLSPADYFKTPLGKVPVDRDIVKELLSFHPGIVADERIHAREHTVEVQLPFLQVTRKDFKIVPILFGVPSLKNCKILSEALSKALKGKKAMLLASTDLSHYPPYEEACQEDQRTLEVVKRLDADKLFSYLKSQKEKDIPNLSTAMCASGGVGTAIFFAREREADSVRILRYANSGDAEIGDKSRVVGYGAVTVSYTHLTLPTN